CILLPRVHSLTRRRSWGASASVVAQRVDELVLRHVRAALDVQLTGSVTQIVDGPVLIRSGRPALLAHLAARAVGRGVGDPGGLLLGVPLVAQLLVELLV